MTRGGHSWCAMVGNGPEPPRKLTKGPTKSGLVAWLPCQPRESWGRTNCSGGCDWLKPLMASVPWPSVLLRVQRLGRRASWGMEPKHGVWKQAVQGNRSTATPCGGDKNNRRRILRRAQEDTRLRRLAAQQRHRVSVVGTAA